VRTINLSIRVQTDSDMADTDVARVVEHLLDQGIDGAGKQLKDALSAPYPPEVADMQLASNLFVSGVEVTTTPRVLITVSGGIADYVCDEGVDVEAFDWDNYNDDPEWTGGVSLHFKDLAEPLEIPVEEPEEISAAPKMGM
jgi:hypothetical protein